MNRYPQTNSLRWPRLGLTALLAVFLLRAMVPPGYMPVLLQAGHAPALSVTLCVKGLPDSVAKSLLVESHPDTVEPQDLSCTFGSALGHVFLLAPIVSSLLLEEPAKTVSPASGFIRPGGARIAGPPLGSRAPPFIVRPA
jgi:hypothetical protein